MRSACLAFLTPVLAVTFSPFVNAQCKDSVVGTWRLVSNTVTTDKGEVNKAVLGQNPSGLLTYTADSRMMAIISDDGRKLLSVPDRIAAPVEERAQAYSTFYGLRRELHLHLRQDGASHRGCLAAKLGQHGSNKVRNPAR
jgi:hypothetical protein